MIFWFFILSSLYLLRLLGLLQPMPPGRKKKAPPDDKEVRESLMTGENKSANRLGLSNSSLRSSLASVELEERKAAADVGLLRALRRANRLSSGGDLTSSCSSLPIALPSPQTGPRRRRG